jgi:predicted nucleotidyltransferase
MRPAVALSQHRDAIRNAVQRHRASNPRVFGSVLHGTDTEDSDLDLLVDPQAGTSLFDLAGLTLELQELMGIRVDVRTPKDLSIRFCQQVLDEAQPV